MGELSDHVISHTSYCGPPVYHPHRPKTKPNLPKAPYLKAKFRVGSCKGNVNFHLREHVFHSDDIPSYKKAKKREVMEMKRSKILDHPPGPWNNSTQPAVIIPTKEFATNLKADRSQPYRFNYRAEVLPPKNPEPLQRKVHKVKVDAMPIEKRNAILAAKAYDRVLAGYHKRTEEMPVHPNLAGKMEWNGSTVLTKQELRARNEATLAACLAHSAAVQAKHDHPATSSKSRRRRKEAAAAADEGVEKKREEGGQQNGGVLHAPRRSSSSSSYPGGLVKQYQVELEATRREKRLERTLKQDPFFSQQQTQKQFLGEEDKAATLSLAHQSSLLSSSSSSVRGGGRQQQKDEAPKSLSEQTRANLILSTSTSSSKQKSEEKQISYDHSGVYEYNKAEGEWMWSDTGSAIKESRGDIKKVHDRSHYNYDSPWKIY